MIRRFFRFLAFCLVVIVMIILFAPTLLKGAGNAVLSSLGNASAQGVAQIIPNATGQGTNLQVQLSGLTANTDYYISLDQGQCGGTALVNVGKITTDSSGSSTATLSLSSIGNALQQSLYLDVHQGAASGQSVACGQVLSTDSVISQFSGSSTTTPTATTVSTTTNSSVSTPTTSTAAVPTGVSNTDTSSISDSTFLHGRLFGGFPDTGVAPADSGSYDNYTYPRKY